MSKPTFETPIDTESLQRLRAGAERDVAEAVETVRQAQIQLGEHQRAAQAHLESAAELEANRQAAYKQAPMSGRASASAMSSATANGRSRRTRTT